MDYKKILELQDWSWLKRPLNSENLVHEVQLPAYLDMLYRLNCTFLLEDFESAEEHALFYLCWWFIHRAKKESLDIYPYSNDETILNLLYSAKYTEPVFEDIHLTNLHYCYWKMISGALKKNFDIENNKEDRIRYLYWIYVWGVKSTYHLSDYEKSLICAPAIGCCTHDGTKPLTKIMSLFRIVEFEENDLNRKLTEREKIQIEAKLFCRQDNSFVIIDDEQVEYLLSPIGDDINYLRIMDLMYSINSYAQESFDLGSVTSKLEYIEWFYEHGIKSYFVDNKLLQPLEEIRKANGLRTRELPSTLSEKTERKIKRKCSSLKTLKDGVNVVGYPLAELGIGEDARTTASALHSNDVSVGAFSLDTESNQHPMQDNSIEDLLIPSLEFNINIINAPPTSGPIAYYDYGKDLFENKYNIGYWPWEFDSWNPKLNFSYNFVDEVWAPSTFLQKAFAQNSNKPVLHMPLAVSLPSFEKLERSHFGLPDDKFLFMFVFDINSKMARKNPYAIIDAFFQAFKGNNNVGLVIKTMYADGGDAIWKEFLESLNNDPRIVVINKVLRKNELLALMECCDSFISLHRSEGFGRCLAESMLLKRPLIATNYSGNTDFCFEDNSWLVNFNLIDVKEGEYVYAEGLHWADPDVAQAVDHLKAVYRNDGHVKQLVENAYYQIVNNHNEIVIGKRYKERLQSIGLS